MPSRRPKFALTASALVLMGCAPPSANARGNGLPTQLAASPGIIVVIDETNWESAIDTARHGTALVYTQIANPTEADFARAAAEAAGLDPSRIQIDVGPLDQLHLADDVADGLIMRPSTAAPSEREILRVLHPGAMAIVGNRTIVKPIPEGLDDWTHPYHGPDNNPLSRDRVARAPFLTRFIAEPRYAPAPQVALASGGRVFHAFGHVAWHEREEPFLSTLAAFNGWNGTLLWRRPLPKGMMVHRNTFVATPDSVFVGDEPSCVRIDAATGQTRGEIRPPPGSTTGSFWKWMGLEGGTLFALIGESEPRDEEQRWKRTAHGWPWTAISTGYNTPENAWGFGADFFAFDPASGHVRWHYRESSQADARAVCLGNGCIFAFRFGEFLTCIDTKTGKPRWRKTPQNDPALFATIGQSLPRQGWQTNWRTAAYLKCGHGALFFAGPQLGKLLALSADDGRVLWQDAYDNFQLILRDDALYGIGGGKWGENISRKFDPLTGKVLAELPIGRRACTRPTATEQDIFFRAMGGSIRFNDAIGRPLWISPMRPECHSGVIIAGGSLYWSPYACDCQLTLNGFVGLAPAKDFDFTPSQITPDRLVIGPGGTRPSSETEAPSSDWPTFRANTSATCASLATIPNDVAPLWQTRLHATAKTPPTAPTVALGMAYLADGHGCAHAIDLATGKERWRFRTGGEIRIPPTIWNGRALFGSADGWAYCCDATTGRLLWQFRAAPIERKIPVFGRLLSTWPASSGILVDPKGTAFVAAGIVNYDGTYVYALDAATGALKWKNDTSGHLDTEARTGASAQGHMLLHADRLYLASGNAFSPAIYSTADGHCLNDPAPLARCESTSPRGWELYLVGNRVIAAGKPFYAHPDIPVYDVTVTKRILHATNGQRDIVWTDGQKLACFPPISPSALNLAPTDEKRGQHIIQPWGGFQPNLPPVWTLACSNSVSVALAQNAALIAYPDSLVALRLTDGSSLWTQPLPAPPVPWGLALGSAGQCLLSLTNGALVCFGN